MYYTPIVLIVLCLLFCVLYLLVVTQRRQQEADRRRLAQRAERRPVVAEVRQVVHCRGRFLRVAEANPLRIQGRMIEGWADHFGEGHFHDLGFFGLRLAGNSAYKTEWLIITLRRASEWLLFDGRWVSSPRESPAEQRPLVSGEGEDRVDLLSPFLEGSQLQGLEAGRRLLRIHLRSPGGDPHLLELPSDTDLLPMKGSGGARLWHPKDQLQEALLLSRDGYLEPTDFGSDQPMHRTLEDADGETDLRIGDDSEAEAAIPKVGG